MARRNKAPRKSPAASESIVDVLGGSNVRGVSAPVTFDLTKDDFRPSRSSSVGVEGKESDEVDGILSPSKEADDGGTGERVKYMTLAREPPI